MFIENNGLLITILLMVLCVVCLSHVIYREFALAGRKNISFDNYDKKKRLFNLHSNKIILICYFICVAITVVFGTLLALSNVTRIYSIITIPLLFFLFIMIVLEFRVSKTNKNIDYYDKLYAKVYDSQNASISIQESINLYEKKRETLVDEKMYIVNELNKCFKIKIESKDIDIKLQSFSELIDDLKKGLLAYDKTLITFFNDSIHSYIFDGKIINKNFDALENPNQKIYTDLIDEIVYDFNKLIVNTTIEGLCYDYFNSDESLISVFDLNERFNIDLCQYSELLISYINNKKDKKNLVSYAQEKAIISLENVLSIINKNDYSWYYINSIPKIYEKNSLKIVESILENNSVECSYAVLSNYSSNISNIIEKIVDNSAIKNDVYDIFKMYISLNTVSNGFNSESNKYENMSYALLNYYNNMKNANNAKKYSDIINDRSFAKNQTDIEKEYKSILDIINDYSKPYINLLVLYGKSSCRDYRYIDYNKSLYLFQELKSNLNLNGINSLCLILESIVLIEENDATIINSISSLLDDEFKCKTHLDSGRKILSYLNKNNHNEFIRILYRIEKQRLSYDALMRL